jgi:caffeoyl-CoA O-methyltransferase
MNQKLDDYAESISSPETDLLKQIHRYTFLNTPYPRMISGPMQGALLRMIAAMIRPMRALEIGTFTGYSAICLAEGMHDQGVLDTIEINPEMEELLIENFKNSGQEHKIRLLIGDAVNILPGLDGPYDLVFLDADKEQYSEYYKLVFDKVAKGGFILADNVLWGGKVVLPIASGDKETKAILDFNNMVRLDDRVEKLVLPLRDGLMLMRKLV